MNRKDWIQLMGLTSITLFLLMVSIKFWEWAGFIQIYLGDELISKNLTELDIWLTVTLLVFTPGIFFSHYLIYYFKKKE